MRRDHPGPAFLDFPLDVVFMEAEDSPPPEDRPAGRARADAAAVDRAAALLRDADRPVIMAGTNLYWGHGEDALRALAEAAGVPVFLNGLARGCLPADHPNFFSRARSAASKGADVALVIGVPMDFRLGFGGAFGEETEIVAIDLAEPEREHPREVAAECYGDIAETLGALTGAGGTDTSGWLAHLRGVETEKREAEREQLDDDRAPLHPMRIYGELAQVLDRDAIVIGDGGDFVCLRRPRGVVVRARLLARPRPVRLPGQRPRLRAGGQARPPRAPGRAAARRRRLRLQRDGVRHPRPPRRQRRRRDGQQRHLGAREAPDGVPLRLLGRRRADAGDALRPDGRGARRARRAGARRPASCGRRSKRAFEASGPTLINVLTDPSVAYPAPPTWPRRELRLGGEAGGPAAARGFRRRVLDRWGQTPLGRTLEETGRAGLPAPLPSRS